MGDLYITCLSSIAYLSDGGVREELTSIGAEYAMSGYHVDLVGSSLLYTLGSCNQLLQVIHYIIL